MVVTIEGATGLGLMNLTWKPNPTPIDDAIETIRYAVEEAGVRYLNGGEFYNFPLDSNLNLQYIQEFAKRYPKLYEKVSLSVKGAFDLKTMEPDCSPEYLEKSISNITKHLPNNYLPIFEAARVDKRYPIEEIVKNLSKFVEDGRIGGISLSEVSADTIRRAAKVAPIVCVEVEFSLLTRDIIDNGVLAACEELNIPIIAYSPLGKGFLTGTINSKADIPEGDIRSNFDRFNDDEVIEHNLKLVHGLKKIAERKGATLAQLSLAWLRKFGEKHVKVLPIPSCSSARRVAENMKEIPLTDSEFKEITDFADSIGVKGRRYNEAYEATLNG
ncbi:BA75_04781T0 [Komagataella pastoris]|uniref:BA75_04781T0 n=1 Tax=Komagataella pastoris TaxID=4922 RepID=A0A1B2JHD9_PICPA|nr:BA75_04781T0 [Komagataella pastoris]